MTDSMAKAIAESELTLKKFFVSVAQGLSRAQQELESAAEKLNKSRREQGDMGILSQQIYRIPSVKAKIQIGVKSVTETDVGIFFVSLASKDERTLLQEVEFTIEAMTPSLDQLAAQRRANWKPTPPETSPKAPSGRDTPGGGSDSNAPSETSALPSKPLSVTIESRTLACPDRDAVVSRVRGTADKYSAIAQQHKDARRLLNAVPPTAYLDLGENEALAFAATDSDTVEVFLLFEPNEGWFGATAQLKGKTFAGSDKRRVRLCDAPERSRVKEALAKRFGSSADHERLNRVRASGDPYLTVEDADLYILYARATPLGADSMVYVIEERAEELLVHSIPLSRS